MGEDKELAFEAVKTFYGQTGKWAHRNIVDYELPADMLKTIVLRLSSIKKCSDKELEAKIVNGLDEYEIEGKVEKRQLDYLIKTNFFS